MRGLIPEVFSRVWMRGQLERRDGSGYQFCPALAINPTSPSTVYAGTDAGGVFKSTNGGASWSAVIHGLTNLDVHFVGH